MKWQSHLGRRALLPALILFLATLQLPGCGGAADLLAGGVGSGGSGLADGAVTGFGSVIVDGVAYDDSAASVLRTDAEGHAVVSEARLGQRVRVSHTDNRASRIEVLPQLLGSASSAPDAQGEFVMLGQRVRIVGSGAADDAATVFDGLTQVKAGDALEVHGSWSRNAAGLSVLVASRIEKLAAVPDPVLLTAPVLARQNRTLVLDDAARTVVSASSLPDTVQAGTLAGLWLPRSTLQQAATASAPWLASRALLASAQADSGTTLALGGDVADIDAQEGRIRVQGVWVRLPAGNTPPPSEGTAVQLQVQRKGNEWEAQSLTTLKSDKQPEVELKGSMLWVGTAGTLQLRGTTVQLPTAWRSESCAAMQAGDPVFVSLKARRQMPGQLPQVTQIECSRQIPESSVYEAEGTLQSLDVAAQTLRVNVAGTTLVLSWSTAQTLMPALSQLRSGMAVEIEYQRNSNGLLLRKLKLD